MFGIDCFDVSTSIYIYCMYHSHTYMHMYHTSYIYMSTYIYRDINIYVYTHICIYKCCICVQTSHTFYTFIHYITLHYITLHYITLHTLHTCITLHTWHAYLARIFITLLPPKVSAKLPRRLPRAGDFCYFEAERIYCTLPVTAVFKIAEACATRQLANPHWLSDPGSWLVAAISVIVHMLVYESGRPLGPHLWLPSDHFPRRFLPPLVVTVIPAP